ncbi:MAG: polysaccharide biosynthesis protein, partial [Gammaproteobacteria bacterium]|nr:polysaccharide biosynthesis protein [Gammaproteobacteria bacterium]
HGGPVTLTHADITRYFMTIPEAAQLVIQAGAMSTSRQGQHSAAESGKPNNAEVYVLDMGEPVKIIDLAKRMIQLSGHQIKDDANPNGDIEIDIVGLRPGEKLYEELLIGNNPQNTQHPRIMKAQEHHIDWSELQPMLATMQIAADNGDVLMIRTLLQQWVPEYQPDEKVADWVYREQITQAEKLERL